MSNRARVLFAISGLLVGAAALAGPPTPPAGPVGPTMKPLDHVEPRTPVTQTTAPGNATNVFVISQPGSYYLTGDIAVTSGKNGIVVTAPDVTLDLCGFMIKGAPGSLAGITTVEADRLIVRNGRISGLGGSGIYAGASPGSALENIVITSCTGNGIVTGADSTADRCTAQSCGGEGFLLEMRSVVRDCVAAGNSKNGFRMPGKSQVIRSTARENREAGISSNGPMNLVRECTVADNIYTGISVVGTGALVTGNYCTGHAGPGGGVTVHTTATDNAVIGNTVIGPPSFGYAVHVVSTGNFIARNVAASSGYNVFNGNAMGPLVNATSMPTNTNPDANYIY